MPVNSTVTTELPIRVESHLIELENGTRSWGQDSHHPHEKTERTVPASIDYATKVERSVLSRRSAVVDPHSAYS